MESHRIEATLERDGTITLNDLPFHAGQTVEVVIVSKAEEPHRPRGYTLRGTPISYADPFEPVGVVDWESSR